jgi:lipopolysaccharide export system permease protein
MIRVRPTLSLYLAQHYGLMLVGLLVALAALMMVFDAIEVLRILSKRDAASVDVVLYMAALKVPQNVMLIAPFVVLFAAMGCIASLNKCQELVVMRMAGGSLWQLLSPMVIVAFCFGLALTTIINPLAAATERQYQRLEEQTLERTQHLVSILNQGLWLRQTEDGPSGRSFILHADRVQLPDWQLDQVMVLFFDREQRFLQRYDAPLARLEAGAWVLPTAQQQGDLMMPQVLTNLRLPTTLTAHDLEQSFTTPETVSIWSMPRFIRILDATGFLTLPLQVRLGSLLMLPILCIGLVMIGATMTLQPGRQRRAGLAIIAGVVFGFVIFFLGNFLQALGASGQIPVWLAATAPAALTLAAGVFAILSHEDR